MQTLILKLPRLTGQITIEISVSESLAALAQDYQCADEQYKKCP
nr:hypothetical protein [Chroococcidiopsis sp. CCMEE 29]